MERHDRWREAPFLIVALGVILTIVALGHHLSELLSLSSLAGPITALVLDGVPAIVLGMGGYRLWRSDLGASARRRVVA